MNSVMLRNAHVHVEHRIAKSKNVAHITVDDKFEHTFDPDSRVSKALELFTPERLSTRLSGGAYYFVDNRLVDFRDSTYDGFIHNDASIEKLIEVLGITPMSHKNQALRSMKRNTVSDSIVLGREWSDHNIVVPGYNSEGNEFASKLLFGWSPFSKNVNSFFMLVRLICANGMMGLTNFLNTRIPLVNRWEEHLEIANRQIQHKVEGISMSRFAIMQRERASVAEARLVANHARKRLENKDMDYDEIDRLNNIISIVDPEAELSHVYHPNVFDDTRLAAQLPAHLTTYDVYNAATEIRTHSHENDKSTNHALDKFANQILFDRDDLIRYASKAAVTSKSYFSNPAQAFFGKPN